jgi:site-specific DNA-methyltransferase (adenine-specific)
MRPYFENDGIVIYHGDCREVMPALTEVKVDMVLTDPPWIARKDKITRRGCGVANVIQPSQGIGYGSIGDFSAEALRMAFEKTDNDMFVICGYKELGQVIAVLEPIRGVFIWHKPNGGISVAYPCPLDVAYIVWGAHTSKITGYQWWKSGVMSHNVPSAGCISNGERILEQKNGKAAHPCQGPLSLYHQLLMPINPGSTILDPFMGSGTSLRAAKDHGIKAIGIEIEERYCEMAAKRLAQGVFNWDEANAE